MSRDATSSIREGYAAVARSGLSTHHPGVRGVAAAFGYSADELAAIPAEANLGLSCGNPTAMAGLRPGEVIVDLGCGGGLDVLLAAQKVGASGQVFGIDMTPEMVALARRNAVDDRGRPLPNVEIKLGMIDDIPLPDGSVDCVLSNCVINLAADKPRVFREIARILKPGGRLAISDIALKQPLPAELAENLAALIGCVAGAIPIGDYEAGLRDAGFADVSIQDARADLNAYAQVDNQAGCCSPAMSTGSGLPVLAEDCCRPAGDTSALHTQLAALLREHDINSYAASVKVFAVKQMQSV